MHPWSLDIIEIFTLYIKRYGKFNITVTILIYKVEMPSNSRENLCGTKNHRHTYRCNIQITSQWIVRCSDQELHSTRNINKRGEIEGLISSNLYLLVYYFLQNWIVHYTWCLRVVLMMKETWNINPGSPTPFWEPILSLVPWYHVSEGKITPWLP